MKSVRALMQHASLNRISCCDIRVDIKVVCKEYLMYVQKFLIVEESTFSSIQTG